VELTGLVEKLHDLEFAAVARLDEVAGKKKSPFSGKPSHGSELFLWLTVLTDHHDHHGVTQ
jgi:hypothetical protein